MANIKNPKKRTMEVYIMLTPVSLSAKRTASLMFQLFMLSSWRYLAKKWMVSSTEMPNAMLNTKTVDGLMECQTIP